MITSEAPIPCQRLVLRRILAFLLLFLATFMIVQDVGLLRVGAPNQVVKESSWTAACVCIWFAIRLLFDQPIKFWHIIGIACLFQISRAAELMAVGSWGLALLLLVSLYRMLQAARWNSIDSLEEALRLDEKAWTHSHELT